MSTPGRREFLKTATAPIWAGLAGAVPARPPNVLLIYADDLGYGDLGCYGSKIRTPNLDRMASQGVRFTHFNSANALCSPSRAALLTGRYATRVKVPRVLFPHDDTGLPDSEVTIAQMLRARNYRSMCIGKWHLGHLPRYLPPARGFDEYFGIPYSNDMDPPVLLDATPEKTEVVEERATMGTLTLRYTEQALRFIEKSKDVPFFLYLPHTFPHVPLGASERFRGRSPLGLYGDVIEELDWSVGELLSALKKHNVESSTLVLFSSDNGPWWQGSPGRLRGRKATTYEGGHRVPLLARFPGRIPRGKTCHSLASTIDVLPTLARLCDAPLPPNPVDGIDIWPLLTGQTPELEREVLLYFDDVHLQCARSGRWKLHIARYNSQAYNPPPPGGRVNLPLPAPELYDLVNDPDESYNLAPQNPRIVTEIQDRVERLIEGFPEEIRRAWSETKSHSPSRTEPAALPRPAA